MSAPLLKQIALNTKADNYPPLQGFITDEGPCAGADCDLCTSTPGYSSKGVLYDVIQGLNNPCVRRLWYRTYNKRSARSTPLLFVRRKNFSAHKDEHLLSNINTLVAWP